MIIHETHCHSTYSGDVPNDKGASIDRLCERGVELGLGSLAVTDHLEIHQTMGCIFPPLDHEGIEKDIFACKEKYGGKLQVVYGVELAQACHKMEKTESILKRYKYDFIIGSVHNVRGYPDFSDMEYDNISDELLTVAWERYLSEMQELCNWGNFDTLAHITYPHRYFKRNNRAYIANVLEKGREQFETILKTIIQKGIALEVNTSGIRQNAGCTFPHTDLIKFYKELGGELLTVGSDAHRDYDIAADIAPTYELLKDLGFKNIVTFYERKPIFHKL